MPCANMETIKLLCTEGAYEDGAESSSRGLSNGRM
jgi:hypothetical protein